MQKLNKMFVTAIAVVATLAPAESFANFGMTSRTSVSVNVAVRSMGSVGPVGCGVNPCGGVPYGPQPFSPNPIAIGVGVGVGVGTHGGPAGYGGGYGYGGHHHGGGYAHFRGGYRRCGQRCKVRKGHCRKKCRGGFRRFALNIGIRGARGAVRIGVRAGRGAVRVGVRVAGRFGRHCRKC